MTESFNALVRRVLDKSGRRRGLEKADLAEQVRLEIGETAFQEMALASFQDRCANAARSKIDDGLPFATTIRGRLVPRRLWKYEDYEAAMLTQANQARSATKRLMAYHLECGRRFERQPNLTTFLAEIDFDRLAKEVIADAELGLAEVAS